MTTLIAIYPDTKRTMTFYDAHHYNWFTKIFGPNVWTFISYGPSPEKAIALAKEKLEEKYKRKQKQPRRTPIGVYPV